MSSVSSAGSVDGWYNRWKKGEPTNQSCYEYRNGRWARRKPSPSTESDIVNTRQLNQFTILSWNIDMMRKLAGPRMRAAISHLRTHVDGKPEPPVIMLNEMIDDHLESMQSTDWIKESYYMTDLTNKNWAGGYGEAINK